MMDKQSPGVPKNHAVSSAVDSARHDPQTVVRSGAENTKVEALANGVNQTLDVLKFLMIKSDYGQFNSRVEILAEGGLST